MLRHAPEQVQTIPQAIRHLIYGRGMSKAQIAELFEVSDTTVGRWEEDDGTPNLRQTRAFIRNVRDTSLKLLFIDFLLAGQGAWYAMPRQTPDVNGDGKVDAADLILELADAADKATSELASQLRSRRKLDGETLADFYGRVDAIIEDLMTAKRIARHAAQSAAQAAAQGVMR